MRKLFTISMGLVLAAVSAKAQTVATFEGLYLSKADTYYVNYANPMMDKGFDNGLAHFEYYYDTSFGGFWSSGFAYTNMRDSVDGSYMNLYSAKTGKGYNNSAKYAAVSAFSPVTIKLNFQAKGQPVKGCYVTNSTYGYEVMKNGDGFGFAKKFGGIPNVQPDWFKLTVKGYQDGVKKPDSVEFYLADFRDSDSTKDYIVKDWRWVNLTALGKVDRITFELSSTDTAGGFGMNNPAYFCMDNFETNETSSSVGNIQADFVAKVYPNPANDKLYIELNDKSINEIIVADMTGKIVTRMNVTSNVILLNTSAYVPGTYFMQIKGENGTASVKFIKQ